mmetsp:Transcript_8578/g.35754  ORF Transcript_8578/g.35754 Transcript_8578/m.35754 type:complete len:278 (-) Transcript_8578:1163-1996(-)
MLRHQLRTCALAAVEQQLRLGCLALLPGRTEDSDEEAVDLRQGHGRAQGGAANGGQRNEGEEVGHAGGLAEEDVLLAEAGASRVRVRHVPGLRPPQDGGRAELARALRLPCLRPQLERGDQLLAVLQEEVARSQRQPREERGGCKEAHEGLVLLQLSGELLLEEGRVVALLLLRPVGAEQRQAVGHRLAAVRHRCREGGGRQAGQEAGGHAAVREVRLEGLRQLVDGGVLVQLVRSKRDNPLLPRYQQRSPDLLRAAVAHYLVAAVEAEACALHCLR